MQKHLFAAPFVLEPLQNGPKPNPDRTGPSLTDRGNCRLLRSTRLSAAIYACRNASHCTATSSLSSDGALFNASRFTPGQSSDREMHD